MAAPLRTRRLVILSGRGEPEAQRCERLVLGDQLGLPVTTYCSGPLGGDQQIGARIVDRAIDILIFFWDPLEPEPHDPDVKAPLRITVV